MEAAHAAETPTVSSAAFARLPVGLLAAAAAAVLLATAWRYGYFGDELYFLSAGKRLAWGYADQPPVLPFLALAMDTLAPGNVFVFRLPAVLATAAGVVFTGLIAYEMGGDRRAQTRAAAAYAICGQFLGSGHYLATSTIDPALWTLIAWLLVRWMRTRDDNLLLWLGVATAVALNVKLLIATFWVAAGIAILLFGPRDLLRRPKLWAGAGIAALSMVPTLWWQAANGWPQLEMGDVIAHETTGGWSGRAGFLPALLTGAGLGIGVVGVLYGLWVLLFSSRLRPYRFLGWTAVGVIALFILSNGRYYYAAGMFGVLWAGAAVHFGQLKPSLWFRWIPTWPVFLLSALYTLPYALPVWPSAWLAEGRDVPRPAYALEEIGWPDLARSVADAYHRLPPEQRERTTLVTAGYWQAGALDRYGADYGLPAVYSPSRGFWYFGHPPETADSVLFVGPDPARLLRSFTDARIVSRVDNATGVRNVSRGMPIWLVTGHTGSWAEAWPALREFRV
ncbi:ArnT family glycosyltransferase [Amycolatopsis japonica]